MALMAPYLLFGFFAAGILSAFVPVSFIQTHLGKGGAVQIIKASLLGVPIPLCSCSVIPVAASLRKHGATRGSTISFLASTPQTGVDSILATWGLMGPVFTLFRTGVAFITGCVCGLFVETLAPDPGDAPAEKSTSECCCGHGDSPTTRWRRVFSYGFGKLPKDIGRALLLGILISGLVGALVPEDFFARHLSSEWISMFAVLGLGIPLYVCSTGSIPIALAMISAGLSPGAALVFLITGPATNAATIATVLGTMGRRAMWIYLASLAGCSLVAGWMLNQILTTQRIIDVTHHHAEAAGWIHHLAGALLFLLLIPAFFPKRTVQ